MKRLATLLAALAFAAAARAAAPVTVTENEALYILDNGIVTASVAKASGDLVSLRYNVPTPNYRYNQERGSFEVNGLKFKGIEMLATVLKPDGSPDLEKDQPGHNVTGLNRGFTDHQYGFWSHDAMGPRASANAVAKITIDPKTNGGARGEVSVKGSSKGRKMGTGPGVAGGANTTGQFAADVEIRFALGRGDSGVYTYCQFEHPADYPATSIGEARFCAKLADFFDWLAVGDDPHHFKSYPASLREGDKYVYTINQANNPAFGWASTTANLGFWCLNASMEYMSGGPTKVEFQGHRDTNQVAAPCVLNYWRSSHYGGAAVDVKEGEHWAKVIGPFMLYVNTGANPQAMFDDAKAQQKKQAAAWPYDWVAGVSYPTKAQRATVQGQLALTDPLAPGGAKMSNVRVGLTAAPWMTNGGGQGPGGQPREIDWQQDAKNYEFWAKATDDGRFEIPNVRPGTYVLHAFADGVLGELVKTNVTIDGGKTNQLGKVAWTPVRKGKQLWDVGIPNRTGEELAGGDRYWEPTIALDYAKLFPNDVNFVVGKSDFRKDWFFQQPPHNENPEAQANPFFGISVGTGRDAKPAVGRATPFGVAFNLASAPKGRAVLRVAICGGGPREFEVTVNDQAAGKADRLIGDGTPTRHGRHGIWYEREVAFDASLLKAGNNVLKIVVPTGPVNNAMMYDYVRLELDETAKSGAGD